MPARIDIDKQAIADFCRKWCVSELSVFGSVLTDRFRQDSDVDVLVTFEPHAQVSLLDIVTMQDELSDMLGRPVDLGEKRSLKPLIRDEVLAHAEVLFAA
jgi:predicted nucleotidyltransferase